MNCQELTQEGVSESVIHRFEICYDTMWKILKRYLQEELGLADVPNSPRPILHLADSNNLLSSPYSQWNQYIDARIGTTHDYSEEKAKKALGIVGNFIDDAIGLYQTMTGGDLGIEPAIDITTEQRKTVLSLLEKYLSNTTAWVYGSRAKWTARPQSDP